MGLFDNIKCEYPLPDPEVQDTTFQTKDLDCCLYYYTLTREGRLVQPMKMDDATTWNRDINWHGVVRFYDYRPDNTWYEYEATFDRGQLVSLKKGEPPKWLTSRAGS